MKQFRLAFIAFIAVVSVARAQDEERRAPPTEIPDFSNLDEYIYEPKSTLKIGVRNISGPTATFSGTGTISAPEGYDKTQLGASFIKRYHDGTVAPDARTTPRLDASGNPMTDPDTGVQLSDPWPADGKTNSWAFSNPLQVDPTRVPLGYVASHSYSAEVIDTALRSSKGRSSTGVDLTVSRDMGNLFGTRITWALMAGMSVNDISAKKMDTVAANLQTITDLYSLYGQNAPTPPYSAPSASTTQTVTNSDGTTQTVVVDTTVLLGNEPASTDTTKTLGDTTSVHNSWKVKGAYYTFRSGPELWIPISTRFRAGVSFGAALVYSGTNYTVTQTFTPETGAEMTQTDTNSAYKLLPGYYADATLQFDLTERAGFFAGAVFQSASSYSQSITNVNARYTTKVDLSNQNGVRAGMSVRF